MPEPRKTLRAKHDDLSAGARAKAMFDNWLEDCALLQHAFVEGLLSQLPDYSKKS